MSHLIQSIDISGTRYCVKHGATTPKWRTASVGLDPYGVSLSGVEDDDHWNTLGGYFSFGTCCLWKATVRFTATGPVAGIGVWAAIIINGVYIDGVFPGGSIGTYDFVVDLNALGVIGRPCGNIWAITAVFEGTVEVIDVTFGPPV